MRRLATLVMLGFALGATGVQAQSFPTKPVRVVVPYPAGGSVDNISRAVTPRLSAIWSQCAHNGLSVGDRRRRGLRRNDAYSHQHECQTYGD